MTAVIAVHNASRAILLIGSKSTVWTLALGGTSGSRIGSRAPQLWPSQYLPREYPSGWTWANSDELCA